VKGGDDIRQEVIAMQVIKKLDKIFINSGIKLRLRPYNVIAVSVNSGIIGIY
jgi:phosphatidylinositol 4-kinase